MIEILLTKLNKSRNLSPVSVKLAIDGQLNEKKLGFADDIDYLVNNNEADFKNLKMF